MVPTDLKAAVWDTYRAGPGSEAHHAAMAAAIAAVNELLAGRTAQP